MLWMQLYFEGAEQLEKTKTLRHERSRYAQASERKPVLLQFGKQRRVLWKTEGGEHS